MVYFIMNTVLLASSHHSQQVSVTYSSLTRLCTNAIIPFNCKGFALKILSLHLCDLSEGEVKFCVCVCVRLCYFLHVCNVCVCEVVQFLHVQRLVRSIRAINTKSGLMNFAIAVACSVEAHPQVRL